jgi:hypothetical protein
LRSADTLSDQIEEIPGVVDALNGVVQSNQTIRVAPRTVGDATIQTPQGSPCGFLFGREPDLV